MHPSKLISQWVLTSETHNVNRLAILTLDLMHNVFLLGSLNRIGDAVQLYQRQEPCSWCYALLCASCSVRGLRPVCSSAWDGVTEGILVRVYNVLSWQEPPQSLWFAFSSPPYCSLSRLAGACPQLPVDTPRPRSTIAISVLPFIGNFALFWGTTTKHHFIQWFIMKTYNTNIYTFRDQCINVFNYRYKVNR